MILQPCTHPHILFREILEWKQTTQWYSLKFMLPLLEKKSNKTLTVLQFIDTTFQIWDKKLYSNTFTLENQTLQLDGKGISYQFYVSLSSQAHLRETMCSKCNNTMEIGGDPAGK